MQDKEKLTEPCKTPSADVDAHERCDPQHGNDTIANHAVQDQEIVRALREFYPQMDKYLYSKTKHSNQTGVELVPYARGIERRMLFGGENPEGSGMPRKRVERLDMRKYTIRVPTELIPQLQPLIEAYRFNDWNALFNFLINHAVKTLKEEHK